MYKENKEKSKCFKVVCTRSLPGVHILRRWKWELKVDISNFNFKKGVDTSYTSLPHADDFKLIYNFICGRVYSINTKAEIKISNKRNSELTQLNTHFFCYPSSYGHGGYTTRLGTANLFSSFTKPSLVQVLWHLRGFSTASFSLYNQNLKKMILQRCLGIK